jgi:hypothetical protein
MNRLHITERGQALIIIAFAAVALFAFAALAIDGSKIYSNHRHSQNASDTAAYAAALSYVRTPLGNWKQAGVDRAANNGYSAADGVTEVDVFLCSDLPRMVNGRLLECTGMPSGANPADYVYVHIKSLVKLYFAPIISWRQYTDHTHAVVLAKEEEETSFFPGYALVSTMLGCPTYNHDPFKVSGNSGTTIINAGILVNSNCTFPQPAYDQGGSSEVDTDTGVCVVGAAQSTNTDPPPTTNCDPIDVNQFSLINPDCGNQEGEIKKVAGVYEASPGWYGPSYNFDSIDDVTPSGTLKLKKGIYCFMDGINLNSTWHITTDWDGDGVRDSDEGVLFFVKEGDITFNGSSYLDIHAINTTGDNFPERFLNYLIYVPPTNHADIKITGDNGSTFSGTILAPTSYIVLNGGTGTVGLSSQIIGYAVAIEGNGTLDINYKATDNAVTTYNPSLSGIE